MELRRKDWLLLPLISVGTLVLLLGGAELLSRVVWTEYDTTACPLQEPGKPATSLAGCVETRKWPETGPIEMKYNECGFRTAEPCGQKQPGQVRGVVLGTSIVQGYMVDYDRSFSALTTESLKQACDRPVDLQNLAVEADERPDLLPLLTSRLDDVDHLEPDFLVLVLSTYDFTHRMDSAGDTPPAPPASALKKIEDWAVNYVKYRSHLFAVLREMAFRNSDFYMHSKFANEDDYGFMDEPLSPVWQGRLANLDRAVGLVVAKAQSLKIPLALMYVPTDPEIRLPVDQAFVKNPAVLEDEFAALSRQYDAALVPLTVALRGRAGTPNLFFPTDGHPAVGAHAAMAETLTKSLLANVPLFAACSSPIDSGLTARG